MKRAAMLLWILCLLIAFTGCTDSVAITPTTDLEQDTYFFYGVTKSNGVYYARLLPTYQEEPNPLDILYVPLAEELRAIFQPNGWVGTWSPEQYRSASELETAVKNETIPLGVRFIYTMTDGRMDSLVENNPYEEMDVTTGEPAGD